MGVTNIQRIFAFEIVVGNMKANVLSYQRHSLCRKLLIEWLMKQVEERYISLLTDFGFKRIFGTAMNKDLLICFLNSLFNGKQVVRDVSYLNPEHVGDVYTDRKAIFDVYCEGENGEKFIVEMQNAYQTYFKDRSLFYSTFPIREQAPKGNDWNFKLNHIYTVALLNFNMNEDAFDKEKIRHHVQLCDTATHKIFYDKLEFIYVEIAKFTPQEVREYEASKKAYRDIKNSIDTAKQEGKQEGLAEGMELGMAKGIEKGRAQGMEEGMAKGMEEGMAKGIEKGMAKGTIDEKNATAKRLLGMGVSDEQVAAITLLPLDHIEKLKSSLDDK